MRSTLLLLLAARTLAQSAEENANSVLAAAADDACASITTGSVGLTVAQTGTTTATVTLSASTAMTYIALKDGWGTIIAYQAGVTASSVPMTWTIDLEPDELYAHVLSTACAASSSQTAKVETWAFKVSQYITSDAVTLEGDTSVNISAPTFSSPSIDDKTIAITFETKTETAATMKWAKGATGSVIYLSETAGAETTTVTFPEGTTSVEACQSTDVTMACGSYSLVSDYVTSYGAGSSGSGLVTTTKKAGTGGGSWSYTVSPTASCDTYTIYAKDSSDAILAFGFDSALSFTATDAALSDFTVYLMCDSGALQYESITVSSIVATYDIGTPEVVVGAADCNGTYASGTTYLDADGRNCTCDMGNAYCMAGETDSSFFLSDGEAVGLALSVSIIVILILMALIFFCLKKTAQKQELVGVLKTNTKEQPPTETDRL